jgi:hypothetical protein
VRLPSGWHPTLPLAEGCPAGKHAIIRRPGR